MTFIFFPLLLYKIKKKAEEQLVINNVQMKQKQLLKYKRVEKSVLLLYNNCLYLMLKTTDYHHINTLIDWNINYDVYASLCVAKYFASAVKSRKQLNGSSHCMGGLLPTYMGGWLTGEGHS